MLRFKYLLSSLLSINVVLAMEQDKNPERTGHGGYEPWPSLYKSLFESVHPRPIRISAEFSPNKFPDHIETILIFDLSGEKEPREVGKLTVDSPRQGPEKARWSINEEYNYQANYLILGYQVFLKSDNVPSPIKKIPAYSHSQDLSKDGEEIDPYQIPVIGEEWYLPALRILFKRNKADIYNLRASFLVGLTLPLSQKASPADGLSAAPTAALPENIPENDLKIFNSLPIRATYILDDYASFMRSIENLYNLKVIIEELAEYHARATQKYQIELDLDKLVRAGEQQGYYRSNLCGLVKKELEELLKKRKDHISIPKVEH